MSPVIPTLRPLVRMKSRAFSMGFQGAVNPPVPLVSPPGGDPRYGEGADRPMLQAEALASLPPHTGAGWSSSGRRPSDQAGTAPEMGRKCVADEVMPRQWAGTEKKCRLRCDRFRRGP